ncbi:aminodeoxychorismate lyase [Paenibacillus konkukensis]|uniref:aminodeoxychorismate lyase n=1 Tax=Paenibacillus konkukensis TaxID=2020716 RepID=UPI00201DBD3C|nr:aminodeoxychorismate lyase [Paenibacillus konkukensis]
MNIYVNGSIIAEQEAVVSVYDHGFLYGMGLFETLRTYKGRPFLLGDHQERLLAGCRQLGIDYSPRPGEWEDLIRRLLESNGLENAYIRFTVTAGEDALGLPSGDYQSPHVIVYVKELPERNEDLYRRGKPLQLLQTARNTPEGSVRFKSLHYMNNILAKRELRQNARSAGAEGLQLDARGYLAEGIVSNLFFIRAGRLFTPSLDTGILPGITRAFVLRLAAELDLPVEEGLYRWPELVQADEAFVTNSIQEIVPVTTLYDLQRTELSLSGGQAGEWTRKLMGRYRSRAEIGNEGDR